MSQMEESKQETSQRTREGKISWQAQAERRWIADLLANKTAVAPWLRCLKATDIGGREGARDRELE